MGINLPLCVFIPVLALIIDPGQTIVQFAVECAAFTEDVDLDKTLQGLDIRLSIGRTFTILIQDCRDEGLVVVVGDVSVINW